MYWQSGRLLLSSIVVVAAVDGLAPRAALAQSTPKAIFEKADLIGRYSQNCKQPTAAQNLSVTHQAVDGDRVRRDQFTAPGTRQFSLLIDKA